MKFKYIITVMLIILMTWAGCSKNPSGPDYQKEVMIYGYLWGNEPLNLEHAISIQYSQPLNEAYDTQKASIQGALVTLTDTLNEESWQLYDTDEAPGRYFNEDIIIRPETTYLLSVKVDDKTITASTTVPTGLTLVTELNPDTLNREYQDNLGYIKPIYVNCNCPDDLMIVVDMFCEEPWETAKYINPFFGYEKPESREEYDGGVNGEPRRIRAFVTYQDLKAADFENKHTIYWYASMIVFYGRQTMQVMAVDENYINYTFDEHPVYCGGIHGGLGVFASMCGDTFPLYIMEE
ncbi:hypothetical protein JW835_04505 [bacterium]|nr:hypothetical protein [bacterium]